MVSPRYGPRPRRLVAGTAARRAVALVARLYHELLGRPPDAEGLGVYVASLLRGKPALALVQDFMRGPEFLARSPGAGPGASERLEAILALPARPVLHLLSEPVLDPADPVAYRWWIEEFEDPFHESAARAAAPATIGGGALLVVGVARAAELALLGHLARSVAAMNPAPAACRVVVAPGLEAAARQALAAFPLLEPAAAADLAGWDPVVLLRAPCALHPRVLAELAAAFASSPACAGFICDEDWLAADGARERPWFKPGFDPEQVGWVAPDGLVALRGTILGAIGAGRVVAALAAGADLGPLLAPSGPIGHVARVLLHRLAGRSASEPARRSAPDVVRAGRVSVLIPIRDRLDLLVPLVEDLRFRTDHPDPEVLILDNGSTAPATRLYLASLARVPGFRVLAAPGPFNWARITALGVAAATGAVMVFMNNDMRVLEPGWLRALEAEALRPEIGAVGALLLYPDGRVQHAGMVLMPDGSGRHVMRHADPDCADYAHLLTRPRQVTAVTGACIATRRAVYEAVGGLDGARYLVTCSDADYCLRVAEAGYRVLFQPSVRLAHLELATRKADQDPEQLARAAAEQAALAARWQARLAHEPFWSPNLALTEGPPALACPPRWPDRTP